MNITKKLVTEITEALITVCGDWTWEDAPKLHDTVRFVLAKGERQWATTENIVAVIAHTHGNPILGYATGTEQDVRAYFNNGNGITLEDVEVVKVPSGFAAHRDNIVAKRDRLQEEVNELNRRLDEKDIHQ